ncbi:hypothetical protein ACQ858_04785 [Variovorax ureilyticus]|uniref:hypothetical protein n=1 Tax=Variovorax ureilyticus TaxID=1836198 RepID=UPI003D665998
MNTERDNFHDWHRDKPDTTSFSGLHRNEMPAYHPPVARWGRLLFFTILGVALVLGFKYFAGL